jgi:HK97 family phage portal protein
MWPFSRSKEPEQRHWVDLSSWTSFGDVTGRSGNTTSGVSITQSTVMTLPVVYRCIQINCETVASLPVDCLVKRPGGREEYPRPSWLDKPNDEQDWADFATQVQYSYELDGNAFILKASSGLTGKLAGMYVLDPRRTMPRRMNVAGTQALVYEVTMEGGRVETFPANAVIHLKGMVPPGELRGLSPIGQLRETFGLVGAAQEFGASFFGYGANLSGVIQMPAGQKLTQEAADRLKADFTKKHGGVSKSHAIGVLSGGAEWKPMSVKPDEAQFIETMKFNSVQIAHAFGVPPVMVTDVSGAAGYVTGVMASRLDWLQTGLLPRITRLERAVSAQLPRPAYIKLNVRGLLRGVPAEQAAQMDADIRNGIRSPNEWRELLDLEPYEGGDDRYYSANLKVVGEKPPEPPPAVMQAPLPGLEPDEAPADAGEQDEEAPQ